MQIYKKHGQKAPIWLGKIVFNHQHKVFFPELVKFIGK